MAFRRPEAFCGATGGAVTEASALDSGALHFGIGEWHSALTRAIAAADTFDATLLAASAALGRVRLHHRNQVISLTRTTNTILAHIRGSKDIDGRKKDLLQQLNGWDVPAMRYISSMQQAAFQIKARLVELGERGHRLGDVRDREAGSWQAASIQRVWHRVERSVSTLSG